MEWIVGMMLFSGILFALIVRQTRKDARKWVEETERRNKDFEKKWERYL